MPTSARWEMSVLGADVGIGPYDDVLYYPRKQQFTVLIVISYLPIDKVGKSC